MELLSNSQPILLSLEEKIRALSAQSAANTRLKISDRYREREWLRVEWS